jgi:uncharacterized protein (TIGR00369 family)
MTGDSPRAGGSRLSGFAQTFGAMMVESGDTFILTPTKELVGNPLLPALHGGAVASFLELAAQLALGRNLLPGQTSRLISANLQFLTPARLVALRTTPQVRRIGRRVAVVHAEAFEKDGAAALCLAQMEFSVRREFLDEDLTSRL